MKKTIMMLMVVVLALFTVGLVAAQSDDCDGPCDGGAANSTTLDIEECLVRINDRLIRSDRVVYKAFERGEELEVRVEFVSNQDAEDVQVFAILSGYDRSTRYQDKVVDFTSVFDVEENVAYEKTLTLELPDDLDLGDLQNDDNLKLRIMISDRDSASYIKDYNLEIESVRHNVVIQDIILDPANSVQAGRGLFAAVRVENMGSQDEDSVKVTTSIPALDLTAVEYIDDLEYNDATTSEDMFLRIPSCTEPGTYVVKATVEFWDGDERVSKETTIQVTEDPACEADDDDSGAGEDRTVVTVPGRQDVVKGTQGTVYPIILENNGNTDRTYEVSASGLDTWATYRFDPGTLTLVKAGEAETVYLYVTPKDDAAAGEKVFMVTVETDGDRKQIALNANVVEGDGGETPGDFGDLSNFLEIAVVVLIVLVVVLALVVAFSRMKGDEENGDEGSQTYY